VSCAFSPPRRGYATDTRRTPQCGTRKADNAHRPDRSPLVCPTPSRLRRHRTPVLAFRQGAATEVVEDGVTGALCDSPERMAEMVNWVDRIDPMACRRRVAEHFSSEAMVLGYDRIFRTLVDDERRGRREKQVREVPWCDAPADEEERDAAGPPAPHLGTAGAIPGRELVHPSPNGHGSRARRSGSPIDPGRRRSD
jgi:hypothetical protein